MNNPSKENPDDRPQPPQRMNSEERSNEQIRADLAHARSDAEHAAVLPCGTLTLFDDLEFALARIAEVEALHFTRGRNILGKPVCAECSPLQPMPCPTLRALAASPTPTGPEPATKPKWVRDPGCVERWPECYDGDYNPACCRFPKSCSCLIPATPEPTEETP